MRRLFLPESSFQADIVTVEGMDHQHLSKVLRMRVGEELLVLDNAGSCWRTEIGSISRNLTTLLCLEKLPSPKAVFPQITIAQAPGKGDRFEQVIQHGTELGASHFQPLITERCMVELSADRIPRHHERWTFIAKGAAEQSHRDWIPEICPPCHFIPFIDSLQAEDMQLALLLHPHEPAVPLFSILQKTEIPGQICVLVGPEGGFSPSEIAIAVQRQIPIVRLGTGILRTETAALVALSQIAYHYHFGLNL